LWLDTSGALCFIVTMRSPCGYFCDHKVTAS
jgi:hypothetical protein